MCVSMPGNKHPVFAGTLWADVADVGLVFYRSCQGLTWTCSVVSMG